MAIWTYNVGDTKTLGEQLLINGSPVPLSGSTVALILTQQGSAGQTLTRSATIVGDPSLGNVSYTIVPGDNLVSGRIYLIQWKVTTTLGGAVRTVPDASPDTVVVQ